MKHWTEEAIRADLDGTFTRVDLDGKYRTVLVPVDFIPSHKPGVKMMGEKEGEAKAPWSPEEDIILLGLARKRTHFDEIAAVLSRREEATRKRYRLLRSRGLS